jgi:hypothetical protein
LAVLSRAVGVSHTTGALWASLLYQDTSSTNPGAKATNVLMQSAGQYDAGESRSYQFGYDMDASAPSVPGVAGARSQAITLISGTAAANDATYLLVAKFQNVGTTGSATVWVLTPQNYSALVSGGITEAGLNGNFTYKAASANNFYASRQIDAGDFLQLNMYSGFQGVSSGIYDEVRYGTTLDSVVLVPEPATWSLCAAGLMGLAALACRGRRP